MDNMAIQNRSIATTQQTQTGGLEGFKNMSDKEAIGILNDYKGKLDTGAGIGGNDKNISDKDLRSIAGDESQPMELRQAAMKALYDKPFREQINQGGENGHSISFNELALAKGNMANQTLGAAPSPRPAAEQPAAQQEQGGAEGAGGKEKNMMEKLMEMIMMMLQLMMQTLLGGGASGARGGSAGGGFRDL